MATRDPWRCPDDPDTLSALSDVPPEMPTVIPDDPFRRRVPAPSRPRSIAPSLTTAALVLTVALPSPRPAVPRKIWDRTTRGIRLYLATPRLRG